MMEDYSDIENQEWICEWKGRDLAKKDAKAFKNGKITKQELVNSLEYARMSAAYSDFEAQIIGYYYLDEMENQGIIKNLRRVD